MGLSVRSLRPAHLILGTLAYWAGLAVIKLSQPLLIAWRLTHLPPGQSSIEAGYSASMVHLTMKHLETIEWSGSISAGSLVIWLFGPPALFLGAWWLSRHAADDLPDDGDQPNVAGAPTDRALPGSELPHSAPTRQLDPEPLKRDRRND